MKFTGLKPEGNKDHRGEDGEKNNNCQLGNLSVL